MDDGVRSRFRGIVKGRLLFNEPVLRRCTLKIGGPADLWFEPSDVEDLAAFLQMCRREQIPLYFVGNGSNLVVRDGGFRGALIHLGAPVFKMIRCEEERLVCGGGAAIPELIRAFQEYGLTGGEFLVGIPGTVGGAIRMNAGAQGREIAQILEAVEAMTLGGEVIRKNRSELDFLYRGAPYFEDKIVMSAVLRLEPGELKKTRALIQKYSRKRAAVTPPHPNAGCIFKNPNGVSAGALIDQAGLKGMRFGDVQVSREHGNYFVNLGRATAQDLLQLMETVKNRVRERHGVELEPEIQIIGEN